MKPKLSLGKGTVMPQKTVQQTEDQSDLERLLGRLKTVHGRALGRKAGEPEVSLSDVLPLPSYGRLQEMMLSPSGQGTLKSRGESIEKNLARYRDIEPQFMQMMFAELKKDEEYKWRPLPGRFAQAAFDISIRHQSIMPSIGPRAITALFNYLGEEEDEKVLSHVQDKMWRYVVDAIREVMDKTGQTETLRAQYSDDRDSADFLNDVCRRIPDRYALFLLNAVEFSGHDFDDPAIIADVFAAQKGLPEPQLKQA